LVLNVFSTDDEEELLSGLFHAMRLLKDDYLGGGGSRGNGQVDIVLDDLRERPLAFYQGDDTAEKQLIEKIPEDLRAK